MTFVDSALRLEAQPGRIDSTPRQLFKSSAYLDIMETFFFNGLAAIACLSLIVFVHEFGHLAMAKLCGVRVRTFSIGFGRRLWGFDYGGTDYRLSVLPIGGYVLLDGETTTGRSLHPNDFSNKPRWLRILFYLAGPFMNAVLSLVVIAGLFVYGFPIQAYQNLPPVVGQVGEDSPAARAGLEIGDRIVSVNGEAVAAWGDFDFLISTSPERDLDLEVARGGETLPMTLRPERHPREGIGLANVGPRLEIRLTVIEDSAAEASGVESGDVLLAIDGDVVNSIDGFVERVKPKTGEEILLRLRRGRQTLELPVVPRDVDGVGMIGVRLGSFRALPVGEALVASLYYNVDIVKKTVSVIGKLLSAEMEAKSALSGPIGIASAAGDFARRGFDYWIFFTGFLSLSIGIMNLLPIPMLDGGHIAILLAEGSIRRDLSAVTKEKINLVGFVMLMMLMAVVVFFDISKLLPVGS